MRRQHSTTTGMITPSGSRVVGRYGLMSRLVLSVLIVLHISATMLWLLPKSSLRNHVRPATDNYIHYLGLWQSWSMFAPDPLSLNMYLSATVTYRDGTQRGWSFPRMPELDLAGRYQQERYRKFQEYARLEGYAFMWPGMARYIAQTTDDQAGNPPVRVQLQRNWWVIPPPLVEQDTIVDAPHTWNRYEFFSTAIAPWDLQP